MTYFSGKFERRRARFPDSKSMAWEFFTDDWLGKHRRSGSHWSCGF